MHTWLLCKRADPPLLDVLKKARLMTKVDVSEERPAARLGLDADNKPALACDDPAALFAYLRANRVGPVFAFATATAAVLDKLHGTVFTHESEFVKVERAAGCPSDDPYGPRLVWLTYWFVAPPSSLAADVPRVNETPADGLGWLFVDPVRVELSATAAKAIYSAADHELAAADALFLPPVPSAAEAGYFTDDMTALRRGLLDLAADHPTADEPAFLTAFRLTADSRAVPHLRRGSGLRLLGGPGEPTTLALGVWGDPADPVAKYAANFVLSPDGVRGPAWAKDVARSVRRDLEEAAAGLKVEAAPAPTVWESDPRPTPPAPGTPAEGSWELFAALRDRIAIRTQKAQFTRLVVKPANPGKPNHDHAERLFVGHVASGGGIDPLAWRTAWAADGLPLLVSDELLPPAERVPGAKFDGPARATYQPDADTGELREWRLRLPLGFTLAPDPVFRPDRDAFDGPAVFAPSEPSELVPLAGALSPRPGRAFTSSEFFAWQRWLLWRFGLPLRATGVHRFDAARSLVVRSGPAGLEAVAGELLGTTPGGAAVVLADGEQLLACAEHLGQPPFVFDAVIDLDPPDGEPAKFRLRLLPASADRPAFDPLRLDLGRFEWKPGEPVRIRTRPCVTHLAAVQPLDATWKDETAVLLNRLRELNTLHAAAEWEPAYRAAVAWLEDRWMALPLDELADKLAHVGWLLGREAGGGPRTAPAPDAFAAVNGVPPRERPAALAALSVPDRQPDSAADPLRPGIDYDTDASDAGLRLTFRRRLGRGGLRFRFATPVSGRPYLRGVNHAQFLAPDGADLIAGPLDLDATAVLTLTPAPGPFALYFFPEVAHARPA